MITYDWPFLLISAGTSAVITLGMIVYLFDITIYSRLCGLFPIFRTFVPFIGSIILFTGIVFIIPLFLRNKLRPRFILLITLAIGVLLGMLLAIFGSCL